LLQHDSRGTPGYSASGDVSLLAGEDRSRWDHAEIIEAVGLVGRAPRMGRPAVLREPNLPTARLDGPERDIRLLADRDSPRRWSKPASGAGRNMVIGPFADHGGARYTW
jgi:hypothetical protein